MRFAFFFFYVNRHIQNPNQQESTIPEILKFNSLEIYTIRNQL